MYCCVSFAVRKLATDVTKSLNTLSSAIHALVRAVLHTASIQQMMPGDDESADVSGNA